jgi:K+-transporting ATPase ATPase C chain
MIAHLRSLIWVTGLTLFLCCVLYPLVLWGIGKAAFSRQASGSLIVPEKADTPAGSELLAQAFDDDRYFHPRPSAVNHDAAASGASNWSANNYLLRERAAQLTGPVVKYGRKSGRAGEPVGPDIETWLHAHPEAIAAWDKEYPGAAKRWLKEEKNAKLVSAWKKQAGKEGDPEVDDVVSFFTSWAAKPRGEWPKEVKRAVQAVFFESWLEKNADVDFDPVPADMVTASGSGLDPHITLKNAEYQLDAVAVAWARETKRSAAALHEEIDGLLRQKAQAPLGGLAGVELVNVLEVNLALRDRYGTQAGSGK